VGRFVELKIKGRVIGDLELPKVSAVKIGNWALVALSPEQIPNLIDLETKSPASVGITQGMNLVDGLSGWKYDPESKTVIVAKKATLISLHSQLPIATAKVFLVLISQRGLDLSGATESHTLVYPASDRLVISTIWRTVTFIGEPYLMVSDRGYQAAINVRTQGGVVMHLMLWAVSLSEPLEILRRRRSKLDGLTIRLRKASQARTAAYQIEMDD